MKKFLCEGKNRTLHQRLKADSSPAVVNEVFALRPVRFEIRAVGLHLHICGPSSSASTFEVTCPVGRFDAGVRGN